MTDIYSGAGKGVDDSAVLLMIMAVAVAALF
jgi:hypothetical protein